MSDPNPREAVLDFFAERGKPIINPAADLFESGVIDSMDLIELVTHMEAIRGDEIPHEALTVDNFRTLDAIVALFTGGSRR